MTGELEEGNVKDEASGKKETFISVLADHYPQTLGSCVMLRPPVFLFSIFNVVKSFMDPKTAKAYYFVRSEKQIEEALGALFDDEVIGSRHWIAMLALKSLLLFRFCSCGETQPILGGRSWAAH